MDHLGRYVAGFPSYSLAAARRLGQNDARAHRFGELTEPQPQEPVLQRDREVADRVGEQFIKDQPGLRSVPKIVWLMSVPALAVATLTH